MYFNKPISNSFNRLVRRCQRRSLFKEVISETHPLLGHSEKNGMYALERGNVLDSELTLKDCEDLGKYISYNILYKNSLNCILEESTNVWEWPSDYSAGGKIWWVLTWPICFLLSITIPDCRKHPRLYVFTFLMCIVWIGTTSYTVAWLITAIGK